MKKEINVTKIKCIISTVMVLCMCLTMIPMVSTNVDAASNIIINGVDIGYADGSYFTKNGKSCANSHWANGRCHHNGVCDDTTSSYCNCMRYWPTGEPSTCQVDLMGSQCFAFARYCQWIVYGSFATSGSSLYYSDLTGTISKSNCTADNLKNKLLGCTPATHIRMPSPHSISVISTSDSGITFTDCNSDGYCKVRVITYTWSQFATYVQGKGGITYTYARIGSPNCTCSISYAGTYTCTTSSASLTIRSGHGSGYSAIGSIPSGATVTVTKADGNWAHVTYNGVSGYASMQYLKKNDTVYHNPLGNLDGYYGGIHSLNISGWAFDADDINAQLDIRVYQGDTCLGFLKANIVRDDVNKAYGCGDYHGFGGQINLDKSIVGLQTFQIWAIGVGGGENTHLGNVTVNIESDTTGPVLYNVNVTKIGPTGYTVTVVPSDPSGIVRVKFPTWTVHNGQDDLITDWDSSSLTDGAQSGDTFSYRVRIADHNYEYGEYTTHIYAWDKYGNWASHPVLVDLQQPDYTEVSREFGDDFYTYIENVGAGTVLTHEPTGFGNGDYATIFTAYTKSDAQIWHFTRNEDNSYQISPKSNESLALHVVDGQDENCAKVILHTATKSLAQRWFISKVNGRYFFRPACSDDRFLDLPGAELQNGLEAQIWNYNGLVAQQIHLGDPYAEEIVAEGTYNGYVYRIFDKNMTWTEAQAYCEQLGGNLASITSQGEQDFIADLIGEKGKMHQYWIGARYLDGEYVWSDGTEWGYTNWDNLEPNGIRNGQIFEEFVHMYNAVNPKVDGTARFKWNDMTNGNSLETEEMFFGLHHVGFVYKAKAKCDACKWNEGVITEKPDCTDKGTIVYTCTVCGETKTDTIAATGHSWNSGTVTTPPTATKDGVKTYTCTTCSETKTEPIPATGEPEVDENAPQLTVDTKTVTAGQTFTVELTASNLPLVKSLMIDNFSYDSKLLEFVSAELNLKNALIADWDSTAMIATVAFGDNTDINGVIMTLTFKAKEDVEGECLISCDIYANQIQTSGNETQVDVSVVAGTVTVMPYSRGDVNGDEFLNSNDAIYLLRYTLSSSRYPINQGGDFNGDGYVNSNDAIYLLRHTLSPSRYPLHG